MATWREKDLGKLFPAFVAAKEKIDVPAKGDCSAVVTEDIILCLMGCERQNLMGKKKNVKMTYQMGTLMCAWIDISQQCPETSFPTNELRDIFQRAIWAKFGGKDREEEYSAILDEVEKYIKNHKETLQKKKQLLILLPLAAQHPHFIVLQIMFEGKGSWTIFDSLQTFKVDKTLPENVKCRDLRYQVAHDLAGRVLGKTLGRKKDLENLVSKFAPQQPDGWSCGYFALQSIIQLAVNLQWRCTKEFVGNDLLGLFRMSLRQGHVNVHQLAEITGELNF
jgi:hypothetical protein